MSNDVTISDITKLAASEELAIVLYTDGGCRQDVKIGGWGVHGYVYKDLPSNVGTGNKKATPTAAGYIQGTGKPPITVTHYIDCLGSIPEDATNNVAELQAAIEALAIIEESNIKKALMLLDSKYTLQGMESWLDKWVNNGWMNSSGHPVANKEQWLIILDSLQRLKAEKVSVRFQWVKAHQEEFGNTIVDNYATLAIRAAVNGKPITDRKYNLAKGYWKQERSATRLLHMPTWYYGVREDARDLSEDGRTIYYQGNLQAPVEFTGKMISDASFSVVYMKEPDVVLETIRKESYKLAQASFYGLAVGYLPLLFKPENYDLCVKYGTRLFTYDLSFNRLLTFKKEVLVEELRPVRRAYYAVDRLESLEGILKSYLSKEVNSGFEYTDVTALLYEPVTGKKTTGQRLKPSITSAVKLIEGVVMCKPVGKNATQMKVKLLLGQDLPDRNTLAAIAEDVCNVLVVTWPDSKVVCHYAVIIETAQDAGIWAGPYSNLILFPD